MPEVRRGIPAGRCIDSEELVCVRTDVAREVRQKSEIRDMTGVELWGGQNKEGWGWF